MSRPVPGSSFCALSFRFPAKRHADDDADEFIYDADDDDDDATSALPITLFLFEFELY